MLIIGKLSLKLQPVSWKNLEEHLEGRHTSRNHPVNWDRDEEERKKQYFRPNAQNQVLALNYPIHFGNVNLAREMLPVVQNSY